MSLKDMITRRGFLSVLGAAPVAAGGLLLLGGSCRGRDSVTVEPSGLVVEGRVYPLYSGTVHYWQHDRQLWPSMLDLLRRMGMLTLCVDIPWSVHERGKREFDFGKGLPELDLVAFLDLAGERGMKILARPGPQLGPEVQGRGVPDRVLFDPRVSARDPFGGTEIEYSATGQYPAPSCFSGIFLDQAALWYDRVAPLIAARLHSHGGPVIAVQVDHQADLTGRLRYPYSLDYHPSAIENYKEWLSLKYSDINALNRVYRTFYSDISQVRPPLDFQAESFAELPRYLDWVRFRQEGLTAILERLGGMLVKRGITGVPLFAALPPAFRSPFLAPGRGKSRTLKFFSLGSSSLPEDYPRERRLTRAAAGSGTFPFRAGVGMGAAIKGPGFPSSLSRVEFMLMAALMYGSRGLNLHLAAERDNWSGCPLTRDGRVRQQYYQICRKLFSFLRESRFNRYCREVRVLLLYNRGLDCLVAAQDRRRDEQNFALGGEVFNEPLDLGFQVSPEACSLWLDQTTELMREIGFDWDCTDTGTNGYRQKDYKVAILPAGDYLDESELEPLRNFIDSGGMLVFGPGKPFMNQEMRPDSRVEGFFSGAAVPLDDFFGPAGEKGRRARSLIHMESPHEVGRLLNALGISPQFTRSNKDIELTLHENPQGDRLLFTANPTEKTQPGDIYFQGRLSVGRWGDPNPVSLEGKLSVELEPYSIQVWEVHRDSA